MTEAELNTIIALPNAAIIAPAGHGKTEMIAEIVKRSARKLLLLTHTNAGVDAITKRLTKKSYFKDKVRGFYDSRFLYEMVSIVH